MASPSSSGPTSLGLFAVRLTLGAWFALSGFSVFHGVGTSRYVDEHLGAAMHLLSENLARYYLGALPYLEIAAGLMVVLGFLTRIGAMLMAILLVTQLLGMTGTGFFFELSRTPPFPAEVVFLALALLLVAAGAGNTALDRKVLGKSGKAGE